MAQAAIAMRLLAIVVALLARCCQGQRVDALSPRYGSIGGRTLLTLYGSGFAADQFNYGPGNDNLGNRVLLQSGTRSYECDVFKEGCNQGQIQCYPRQGMVPDYYYPAVAVNGVFINSSQICPISKSRCLYNPYDAVTPKITSVTPLTTTPGTVVNICGTIFTSRYGSDVSASTNGRTEKFIRAYCGGQECKLLCAADNSSSTQCSINLDNDGLADTGCFLCNMQGTYVSNINCSFIIEGMFGGSLATLSSLQSYASGALAMLQTYAVVNDTTPSEGSKAGGTRLTIRGNNFDDTDSPLRVTVTGQPCDVETFNDTQIVCVTGPQPTSTSTNVSLYPGCRGVRHKVWHGARVTKLSAIYNLSSSMDNYEEKWLDQFWFSYNESAYVSLTTGFFVPPKSGAYSFQMQSPGGTASMYFSDSDSFLDKVSLLNSSGTNWASSIRKQLQQGKAYPIEVIQAAVIPANSFVLAVVMYDTDKTDAMTSDARNERQQVKITSTATSESQQVSFLNWTEAAQAVVPVKEVQAVSLTNITSGTPTLFRLSVCNALTAWMPVNALAATVQAELNSLPTVYPSAVTVSSADTSDSRTLNVTFAADWAWTLINIQISDGSSVQGRVARLVPGVPTMTKAVLTLDGKCAPAVNFNASAADVLASITALFSIRCHLSLSRPAKAITGYFEDFESQLSGYFITPFGDVAGTSVSDPYPFSGRGYLKNPYYLFHLANASALALTTYPKLCFAYRGASSSVLTVSYLYVDNGTATTSADPFTLPQLASSTGWNYLCVDLLALAKAQHPTGSSFRVTYVQLGRSSGDLFVDVVFVGKVDAFENYTAAAESCVVPPRGYLLTSATVTSAVRSVYAITMSPFNCSYPFSLFDVVGSSAAVRNGNSSVNYTFASPAAASVVRLSTASPPVTGSFSLTLNGVTISNIPASASADQMAALLQTVPGIGTVSVTVTGSCLGLMWDVKFVSRAGDLPQMIPYATALQGVNANVSVTTVTDGSIVFSPIIGDMLLAPAARPQAVVYVNGIPSYCDDGIIGGSTRGGFTWTDAATPAVSSISPSSGLARQDIIVYGSKFGTMASAVEVFVGSFACTVASVRDDQIACRTNISGAGNYTVSVVVAGKGAATGSPTYSHPLVIVDVSPRSGSVTGGNTLLITGTGLMPTVKIDVGGVSCPLISFFNETALTCRILPYNGTAASVTVTATLDDGTQTRSSATYAFVEQSGVAKITRVEQVTAPVDGDTVVTIIGSDFGSALLTNNAVSLDGAPDLPILLTYSNTQIVVKLHPCPPGTYAVRVLTSLGYADTRTSNSSSVTCRLEVSSVTPKVGSALGGTVVTISGTGFSQNVTNLAVTVGRAPCAIQTSTLNQIVCQVGSLAALYTVDNSGARPSFGVGFNWNPNALRVMVGDCVTWRWNAPSGAGAQVGYMVQQVKSAGDTAPLPGGFSSSSPKTPYGSYTFCFTLPGTNYYVSPAVDATGTVNMWGTVQVDPRPQTESSAILVRVGDFQASVASAVRLRRSIEKRAAAVGSCVPEQAQCSTAAGGTGASFGGCQPPTVTSIAPSTGTRYTVISLSGTGFSVQCCNNIVTIGGKPCVVSSCNSTNIQCTVDPQDSLQPGVPQPVQLTVSNIGSALIVGTSTAATSFVLQPVVTSVQPSAGSTAGGQTVTIAGSGFYGTNQVLIGAARCNVVAVESSYSTIKCITSAGQPWSGEISAATTNDVPINVVATNACAPRSCQYAYSVASTPTIAAVTPTHVSGASTLLTINGTLFTSSADLLVTVGGVNCSVTAVPDDKTIQCTVGYVPVGAASVAVRSLTKGFASGSLSVTSDAVLSSIDPKCGSTLGGATLTLIGNGFVPGSTDVAVGTVACKVTATTANTVTCITGARSSIANAPIVVRSAGVTYPALTQQFNYSLACTPTVASVSPSSGNAGDTITLAGTSLTSTYGGLPLVSIGGKACAVTASTASTVVCNAPANSGGVYSVVVSVPPIGLAVVNVTAKFTYSLSATSFNPTSGSYGGGQVVTVVGSGFGNDTGVTVCGVTGRLVSVSPTQLVFRTPPNSDVAATTQCDVQLIGNGNLSVAVPGKYSYSAIRSAVIVSISPKRGGTAGGTRLTIQGENFRSGSSGAIAVTIDGSICDIMSSSETSIVCETNAHSGTLQAPVEVQLGQNGIAKQSGILFYYVDLWSSPFTWGNTPPPTTGDFVVIQEKQTVVLDVSTPVLKMLLIQGGTLIFDEADIELQSENILILANGTLQIGTESQPFQHKAIITLHGHLRSPELPVFGAKTLGVRSGILDLHGTPRIPWTVLARTAYPGNSTIALQQPVDWQPGDEIVVATTGDYLSQRESEKVIVQSVSDDRKSVTLTASLQYQHLGETVTFPNGRQLEMRAEVGLLTHNVVVRGSENIEWLETIPACPAGFNPGQFATQTCFQGRFGEEMGSDGFGASIMLSAPTMDQHLVTHRISHVEIYHAGQSFRLGRYPIHLHMNGDMSNSYVRGCSIHRTFNRAMNIHNTHNTLFEYNVVYDIQGGAVFLEDSIEHGNILQYNLAIKVLPSTSLLNDDVTPAAFWVTYPDNIVRHNHAAGGSHIGYWYRMLDRPNGPSYTPYICPKNVPLGVFENNTVHSMGTFGLWTFEQYFPVGTGLCSDTVPTPAVFRSLTAWHCSKGAEYVDAGAVQFVDFLVASNAEAGIEGKRNMVPQAYRNSPTGPLIANSTIVGRDPLSSGCTPRGLVAPYSYGLDVRGVTFINFDRPGCAAIGMTTITGTCMVFCGGYTYRFSDIAWINAARKGCFRWEHEASFEDLDGTFSGLAGAKVIPNNPTLDSSICVDAPGFGECVVRGVRCATPNHFHRYAHTGLDPASLIGKALLLCRPGFGCSTLPFRKKDLTHKPGHFCMLEGGQQYNMAFENAQFITNVSFTGTVYNLRVPDYTILMMTFMQNPDYFQLVDNSRARGNRCPLDNAQNCIGDWCFANDTHTFSGIVNYRDPVADGTCSAPPTANPAAVPRDIDVHLRVYACYFTNCLPPVSGTAQPTTCSRPSTAKYWSDPATWTSGGSAPKDGDDLTVAAGTWLVIDVSQPPVLGKVFVYGTLEFEYKAVNGSVLDITLSASHIVVEGGHLIAGCPGQPILGRITIRLRGNHSTPELYTPNGGPPIGAKALAVFGSLDLHGKDRRIYWTQLAQTANAGDTSLNLAAAVDWQPGEEIIVTTSAFSAYQNEKLMIKAVSVDGLTVTLSSPLLYRHVASSSTYDQYTYSVAAEVGLLSRNIIVEGESYPSLQQESFGARVLVGSFSSDGTNVLTGNARVENVRFYHSGQDGFVDASDPRFSLAFLDTGQSSNGPQQSYCRRNSFDEGFNTAIGILGSTAGVAVEDNVIYKTVGAGILITGNNVALRRNLVTLSQFSGSYNNRTETLNLLPMGSIEIQGATGTVMEDNAVAGSERSGYRVNGLLCGSMPLWQRNVAHSVLVGVDILPQLGVSPCTWVTGFTVYKAWYYGIYTQVPYDTVISNVMLIENTLGLLSIVYTPNVVSHELVRHYIQYRDSLIVGHDDVFGCNDTMSTTDESVVIAAPMMTSWNSPTGGHVGLSFGMFLSADNHAPRKPWKGMMFYNGLYGTTFVEGLVFANFNAYCNGLSDTVITSAISNDDGQHPVEIRGTKMYNVAHSSKVYYFIPDLGKINPSDCVDMDCDGKKKTLITDKDGTFLTQPGDTVIPKAEFEWNGDPQRGLGDYRIPKTLLTAPNGSRIAVDTVAPYKGIVNNRNCTWVPEWFAYECSNNSVNYKMLMIESMDPDTETRRLSPVAVLVRSYIDLINGPQDHGWCSGYTCRRRVSTFMALVASCEHHVIHFSSTSPQHLRLMLIHPADSDAITAELYYSTPYRIDVYLGGTYVPPLNAYWQSGSIKYNTPGYYCQYCPTCSSANGANFQDRWLQLMYVAVKGSIPVDIIISNVVTLSFEMPAMTVDDFYGANVVNNLAIFLRVPPEKIRLVNVVRETSSSTSSAVGRRRRALPSGSVLVTFEIGDAPPIVSINDTVTSSMNSSQLQDAYHQLMDAVQQGQLSNVLNVSVTKVYLAPPLPAANSSNWADIVAAATSGNGTSSLYQGAAVVIPARLELQIAAPLRAVAGQPFPEQPTVQLLSSAGELVTQFGSIMWAVTAVLNGSSSSSSSGPELLGGTTTQPIVAGWANFTDLFVNASGSDYVIIFYVSNPSTATAITIQTSSFAVNSVSTPSSFATSPESTTYSLAVSPVTSSPVNTTYSLAVSPVTSSPVKTTYSLAVSPVTSSPVNTTYSLAVSPVTSSPVTTPSQTATATATTLPPQSETATATTTTLPPPSETATATTSQAATSTVPVVSQLNTTGLQPWAAAVIAVSALAVAAGAVTLGLLMAKKAALTAAKVANYPGNNYALNGEVAESADVGNGAGDQLSGAPGGAPPPAAATAHPEANVGTSPSGITNVL